MTSYVYVLKFLHPLYGTSHWYVGCRYAEGCHPDDLLTTYFTSSKSVRELIDLFGVSRFSVKSVKLFEDQKDAKQYEEELVRRAIRFGLKLGDRLLNRNIPNTGWQTANLKGIPKSKEHVAKSVATRKSEGSYHCGSKHGRAKKFLLISPDGVEYHLFGNLKSKCAELGLSWQSLYNNLDKGVYIGGTGKYNKVKRITETFLRTLGWELRRETK